MKKYIEKELELICEKLKNENDEKTKEQLIRTLSNLKLIESDIKNKDNEANCNKILTLSDTQIDEELLNIIQEILNLYSSIPLLETESSMSYPCLRNDNSITNEDIILTINNFYNSELNVQSKKYFSVKNIKIFDVPFLKRLFSKSNCVVYNNYYTDNSYILLNRFYNIKDYIITGSRGIELLPEFKLKKYTNLINLMRLFMERRFLYYLDENKKSNDCFDYKQILTDCTIINSRIAKKILESSSWEKLPRSKQSFIINLFDGIIADTLASDLNFHLTSLIDMSSPNDLSKEYNNLDIDQNIKDNIEKIYNYRIRKL